MTQPARGTFEVSSNVETNRVISYNLTPDHSNSWERPPETVTTTTIISYLFPILVGNLVVDPCWFLASILGNIAKLCISFCTMQLLWVAFNISHSSTDMDC